MIKKSITVTQAQEDWIQSQLATGQYASDSEVIREALREKQTRSEQEREWLRRELQKGLDSGISKRTPEEIRAAVLARHNKK